MTLRFGLKLSQRATMAEYRDYWQLTEDAGFDSAWVMDHFATIDQDVDGAIFEAWTMQAAMAVATSTVRIGCMVTGQHVPAPGRAREDGGHGGSPLRRPAGVRHRRRLECLRARRDRTRARRAQAAARQVRGGVRDHPVAVDPGADDVRRRALHGHRSGRRAQARAAADPVLDRWKRPQADTSDRRPYADVWNWTGPTSTTSATPPPPSIATARPSTATRVRSPVPSSSGCPTARTQCVEQVADVARRGATEIIFISRVPHPVADGERLAAMLPRFRKLG